MIKKSWIKILLFALFSIVFMNACEKRKTELESIRIGYLSLTANLPLFVALENGYFKEAGLNVETIRFETSNQMVDALVTGRIEVETAASASVVVTVGQTIDDKIKVFMLNVFTPKNFLSSLLVKKDSGLKSAHDLNKKKIGTFPGSTMKTYTQLFLKKVGITASEIIQLTPSTQLGALGSGSIDALVTLEPIGTLGEFKGIAFKIEEGVIEKHVLNPWVAGTNSFSSHFLKNYPEKAKQVQAIFYKAVDYIRSYPEEAKKTMTKYTPVKDERLAARLTIPHYWKRNEMNISEFQKMADTLLDNRIIEKKVNVSRLLVSE